MGTRRSVVAVATVGLFLAACTNGGDGDGSGSTLPDRTNSSSASASPTEPPPTPTPTDPTAALEAEITAFFESYIATVNESWTSEEALARRRQMFADSCQACLVGYGFAERVHREGLRFEGGAAVAQDVQLTSYADGVAVFLALVDTPVGRIVDASGAPIQDFDAAVDRQTVYQATRDDQGNYVIIASEAL